MTTKQSTESWIAEALSDTEKEGGLTALSLIHVVGMGTDEVHTAKLGGKSHTPRQWAELFEHKARGRAGNLPGTQYFKLLAFYGGRNQSEGNFPLTVGEDGKVGADSMGALLDAPTREGAFGQSMRHTQVMHSQVFNRQASMDQYTMGMQAQAYQTIQSLLGTVQSLIHENLSAVEFVKKVILEADDQKHKRRIEELTLLRSIQREEGLVKLLPSLANTVSGRKIFPEATEDTSLLSAIAKGIPLDRVGSLVQMLNVPPEVQGAIMSRFEQLVREDAEEKKRARELAGSTSVVEDELGAELVTTTPGQPTAPSPTAGGGNGVGGGGHAS